MRAIVVSAIAAGLLTCAAAARADDQVLPDLGADVVPLDQAPPEADPCSLLPGDELFGLDWTRRQLFGAVCRSARWFDSFFGEERYDDEALGIRGRLILGVEERERVGMTFTPRFSARVPLPNLNERVSLLIERDDEDRTIVGRTDAEQDVLTPPPSFRDETTQLALGYLRRNVNLRAGVRLSGGALDAFTRARYREEFLQTARTQWLFSQSLFWRQQEGFGETTTLDFEAKPSVPSLIRWFNAATWSESTTGLSWVSGVTFYRNIGTGKAFLIEPSLQGQTDLPVDISSYGGRVAYRQTMGRSWLIGEAFTGYAWPKFTAGETRHSQFFVGVRVELLFGEQP
ncbi:MAG TPA: hypothetical protein VMP00_15765 [Burkholderiales bacterium]|nr:hypothetical protein [Burkholderiales bacterium]